MAVEVRHLLLGGLLDLLLGHPADDLRADRLGARFDARGLLEEIAHRRGLGDEYEATVLENGDHHRNRNTGFHLLLTRVQMPSKIHYGYGLAAERGPHGRTRMC